jgi:hypothetical protein
MLLNSIFGLYPVCRLLSQNFSTSSLSATVLALWLFKLYHYTTTAQTYALWRADVVIDTLSFTRSIAHADLAIPTSNVWKGP